MRQLGSEDENGQRVDEPGHHAAGDEAHQLGDTDHAERDLKDAGEDDRGDEVVESVVVDDRRHDKRNSAGGGGDHRRPASDHGDGDGHGERREQPHTRVDPGDDRERDGLGDERERHHQTCQHLPPEIAW